jgi:hemolysin activation/secretion protein
VGGTRLARLTCAAVLLGVLAVARAQPAPAPHFTIERFLVEGNTLIPAKEVDAMLAPFTGPNRDFADVQRALEALQRAYIERGYQAVRVVVPEQTLTSGKVRLEVVEAKLRNVRVEGNRFFDSANVRASLPAVQAGQVPNTRRIGENVQLANENPAKQVTVQLQSTPEPGQVDAALQVKDEKPTRAFVSLDNTGTGDTGYYRVGIGYQNANVADRDQVVNLQAVTSPTRPNDVKIFGAGYRIPVYSHEGMIDLIAGYSDVNSGTLQSLFTVSGKGTIFAARYTQVLPRMQDYQQRLAVGLDYRAYNPNVGLVGTSGTLLSDITLHPVTLTYSGRLSGVGSDLSLALSYSQNIPGGSDGDDAAFAQRGAGDAAHYSIWRYGASYTQALPRDFLFRAALDGQYTGDLLVAEEQFGMGGINSVRGYYERETENDIGERGTLELYSPEIPALLGVGWHARALVFGDWAHGQDNSPEREPNSNLQSVGVGLRVNQGKTWAARADIAYVRKSAGTQTDGSNMFNFVVGYSF